MDFVVTYHKSSSVGAVSSSRDWKWWDWWGCVWMCVVQRLQTQEILSAQCSNLNPDPGKHLMLCITSDQMAPPLWLDVILAWLTNVVWSPMVELVWLWATANCSSSCSLGLSAETSHWHECSCPSWVQPLGDVPHSAAKLEPGELGFFWCLIVF